MAVELPLPELTDTTEEGFLHAWTRFELIAAAKEWDEEKQLKVLPTMLRGKLLETYMDLAGEEKADLVKLKDALLKKASFRVDPLLVGKTFMECIQGPEEGVEAFSVCLKKLFKQAFTRADASSSDVLLQKFLTGLATNISKQLLMQTTPTTFEDAVKAAVRVENALSFGAVSKKPESHDEIACYQVQDKSVEALTSMMQTMESISKRLETLELAAKERTSPIRQRQEKRVRYRVIKCWNCGEEGHFQRDCPLNSRRPTRGWLGQKLNDHSSTTLIELNAIFHIDGTFDKHNTSFLLDTGAAASIIRWDSLPLLYQNRITERSPQMVGANGSPLNVIGQVTLPLTLKDFSCEHSFFVARDLTVPCLLGLDFMTANNAIINCKEATLTLGSTVTPIEIHKRCASELKVVAAEDIDLPGNALAVIRGCVEGNVTTVSEGYFEPLTQGNLPKRTSLARCLTSILTDKQVTLQAMNTSPTPIRIYKNSVLGTLVPNQNILIVDTESPAVCKTGGDHRGNVPSIAASCPHLTMAEKNQLQQLLHSYSDVFVSKGDPLGRTGKVKHPITTTGRPIRQPRRRIPEILRKAVDTETQRMIEQGVIRKSSSLWSSPIVMVRKKDGSWRFCVDYRQLNSVTHRDAYPIPRIDDTLDTLSGSKYFTTLDLASGYWQVEIEEMDKEKTAFSTRQGHFEFNVMPFGLTNAPATFQRLMECVLMGLTADQCLIYLDDIIIFSANISDHMERLNNVLSRIRTAGLKIQTSKCQFLQEEVQYLGHIVSAAGIQPDSRKIQAVADYPTPRSSKELRQFLGLTNYYRRFVKDYAKMACPLFELVKKSVRFQWSTLADESFEALKHCLVNPPVLAFPDFQNRFTLHTDASDTALGAVLSQHQKDKECVVAYWSRQLQKSERRYSATEREALAVVAAVKEFYPYLYGFPFTLVTDHNPLTALKNLKDVGGRISRWMMYLQQFQYTIEYQPGKQHTNADTLSRIPIHVIDTFLPTISADQLKAAQLEDEVLKPVVDALVNETPLPCSMPPGLRHAQLKDGLLCRKFKECSSQSVYNQLVIPSPLRNMVCHQVHDQSGHLGYIKTLEKVKERFYWPGYEKDVQEWLLGCNKCQRCNPPTPSPRAPLGTITATFPFEKISWDIMGPLPRSSKGNQYILVITDIFSKWVEAYPLPSTNAETLASVLVNGFICRFGVPRSLHSDQGANLTGAVMKALCNLLGINRTQTSAYHPQGNGQVERFNRTLEAMLSKVVADNQADWDTHLPRVLFAYRTAIHETTKFSPFRIVYGRSPILPVDVMIGRDHSIQGLGKPIPAHVRDVGKSLHSMFQIIRGHQSQAHQRNKRRYDERISGGSFVVGDRVWLYVPAVKKGTSKKFSCLWRGPYTVIDKVNTYNYRIQLIGTTHSLVVHRNRMKQCFGEPESTTVSDVTRGHDEANGGWTRLECEPETALVDANDVTDDDRDSLDVTGPVTAHEDVTLPTLSPRGVQQVPVRHSTRTRKQTDFGPFCRH